MSPKASKKHLADRSTVSSKSASFQDDTPNPESMKRFWRDTLRAASGEMSKAPEDLDELFASIDNVLDSVSDQNALQPDEEDPFEATDEELDEQLQTKDRALQTTKRKIEQQQELLEDEAVRLKSFKRSRISQEKRETAQEAERLHVHARAIINEDLAKQRWIPARAFAALEAQRRSHGCKGHSHDEAEAYDPAADAFVGGLLRRLQPILTRTSAK